MDREQQRAAARAHAEFTATPVKVPLKAWGGDIFVRRISVEQALAQRETASAADDPRVLARLTANRICDEHGELTFDPGSEEDVDLLLAQGVGWLTELQLAIAEVDSPKPQSAPSASS